ncbi:MAG: zf-HC2 domain-containing protein [Acidimicrobiales bacterium]
MSRKLPWVSGSETHGEISCRQVAKDLQLFLDKEETSATREQLAAHLEACRECGLEAEVYDRIKDSLARTAPALDDDAVERLKAFGAQLSDPTSSERP